MNQSALVGGALLAGFALFLAARDRLSVYGRILWGAKPDSHADAATAPAKPSDPLDSLLPSLIGPGATILGPGAAAGLYMGGSEVADLFSGN